MSNLIGRRDRLREAVPHIASASGAIASFQTDMRSPLEEIKIHFNPQQAAGTPSPTNVLPITGWTGCDLSSSKKNLFDLSWILTPTGSLSDGVLTDVMYRLYQAFAASVKPVPNTIYKSQISISVTAKTDQAYTSEGRGFTVKAKYDDGSESNVVYFANTITDYTTVTGVTASNKKVMSLHIEYGSGGSNRWWIKDFMVVSGATVEPYESFVGNQIPVSWSALGTVYGGWVNPINGGVWADWEYGDMGDLRWDSASSVSSTYVRNRSWVTAYGGNSNARPYLYCDQTDAVSYNVFNNSIGVNGHFAQINSGGYFYYMSPDISGFTSTHVTTFLTGQKYVIKSTPVLVGTISPIQLKTLIGTNNIWSNANGAVDVKYWKH